MQRAALDVVGADVRERLAIGHVPVHSDHRDTGVDHRLDGRRQRRASFGLITNPSISCAMTASRSAVCLVELGAPFSLPVELDEFDTAELVGVLLRQIHHVDEERKVQARHRKGNPQSLSCAAGRTDGSARPHRPPPRRRLRP